MKSAAKNSGFKFRGDDKFRLQNYIIPAITIVLSLIWLLAVFKVFILEGRKESSLSLSSIENIGDIPRLAVVDGGGSRGATKTKIHLKSHPSLPDQNHNALQSDQKHKLPSSGEWQFIRASPNYNSEHGKIKVSKGSSESADLSIKKDIVPIASSDRIVVKSNRDVAPSNDGGLVSTSELKWPPVQLDGTIPANEGTDTMPLTNIKVPRFWSPPEGADITKVGSNVNGQETIFLMIASYRDFQCRETITSAFNRADHPERLFVGAVDQVVPGDIGCLDIDVPCEKNPDQPICKYRNQISVYKMDAQYATGPVTARHIGDRMYRGEYFVMQMDAHCMFIRHWDTKIINQWKSTHNEMAVLRYRTSFFPQC